MNASSLKALMLVASVLGIADAWYLTQSALTDTPLTCTIEGLDGCNIVAQSAYSHLFGLPLALYGVVFYALVFAITAVSFFVKNARLPLALFALSAVGLAASLVFVGIQIVLIQAVCIYCIASAIIALILFACSLPLWRKSRQKDAAPAVLPWGADMVS
jgi:uncharacterized membrane protein